MKKTIIGSCLNLAVILAALSSASCSKALDLTPGDRFSPATVWGSETTADSYLIGLYAEIGQNSEFCPGGSGSAPNLTDAYSDILKSTSWNQYNHPYNKALYQESAFDGNSAGPFECWHATYNRIRRQNEFLRDAPHYKDKFSEGFMPVRIAEARFIRAYSYYRLARVYGGAILRTEVDGPKQNDKVRASEADTWKFIMDELKEAAEDLPVSWDASNYGRATKKAAYGLLSRVALYAHDWQTAADAARKTAEYGGALKQAAAADIQTLADNYASIFTDNVNDPEICFATEYNPSYFSHRLDAFLRPPADAPGKVYIGFVPTSELADSYQMADGNDFDWSVYGSDPYSGREPRFYATLLYNGSQWHGRTIETFVGGTDGYLPYENSSAVNSTVTGYYMRKFLTSGDDSWINNESGQYCIMCRYAEVLLNKAEALAELDFGANSKEALEALNAVRARVGLPPRATTDKSAFLGYVRDERKVELAGEGFRYWDLRRWRLAEQTINGQNVHACKITRADNGWKYETVDADAGNKRIFYPRYYHFAVPLAERSHNSLCDNNEGWN